MKDFVKINNYAESRNGTGEPIIGVNPGSRQVGLTFDPNPSANFVSVESEGD